MTRADIVCLILSGLVLLGLAVHIGHQFYRRAHPKPRPPGALTSVEQGRADRS